MKKVCEMHNGSHACELPAGHAGEHYAEVMMAGTLHGVRWMNVASEPKVTKASF